MRKPDLKARNEKIDREYGMTEQTVRGHIRNAKAIYNWSHRFGFASSNPFADFDDQPLPTKANHYVTVKDFEKLVKKSPSSGWKAMFGLCRLAGLRRTEALTFPWSGTAKDKHGQEHWVGVDWKRRRLSLVAVKTRMHREVPICPRLYELLVEAKMRLHDKGIVTGLSPNNLTRLAQAMVKAAKLKPWPKLYQAMRSSCENDWKTGGVAEAAYAAWMGHSPKVSRESYVAPTDDEFAAITEAA